MSSKQLSLPMQQLAQKLFKPRGNSPNMAYHADQKNHQSRNPKLSEDHHHNNNNNSTDCSSDSDQSNKPKTADDKKYKTEMCKNFQSTGTCNYGRKCRFAHGKADLAFKPIQLSKTYKTKICKVFYEEMTCPYGSRCHFKHDQRTIQEIKANKLFSKKLAQCDKFTDESIKTHCSSRLGFFQSLTKQY